MLHYFLPFSAEGKEEDQELKLGKSVPCATFGSTRCLEVSKLLSLHNAAASFLSQNFVVFLFRVFSMYVLA
jgi:hypothetical protein